ncbi:hypothetical protein [Streptacidiphilus sp. EB129]|uniref:hypothetical protein n=1 Tax=Streptacidiphilus sp. EB129 TaxID=3156262 RepID=UPI003518CB69
MSRVAGKYGKLGPRFPVALKDFTAYAAAPLPAPPASVDWASGVSTWPMDGNDQYGDCTMAAAAHLIQSWNAQTKEQDPVPTAQQVVDQYFTLSGGQDSGLAESDVLKAWQTGGLWGNQVVAYAPVNVHALTAIRQTIALFGGVYAGIQVPSNAQQQFQAGQPWTLDPGWQSQPIEGGHAIPLLGYDADWLYVITWGAVQKVAWDWWSTYSDEAWAVLAQQYREAGTVNGIDLATLTADLKGV